MADTSGATKIRGTYDRKFKLVADSFRRSVIEDDGNGQSLAVAVDGDLVVDLWGGREAFGQKRLWAADTLAPMMSVGKSVAAVCLLHLIDRGAADLDGRVAEIWPEFAQRGKQEITIRDVLGHKAGLPFADAAADNPLDHEAVARALETQKPAWEAAEAGGYHSYSYGFLVAEIVLRLSGSSLGAYLNRHVAPQLGEDFFFGVPPEEQGRCLDFAIDTESPFFSMMLDSKNPVGRSWSSARLAELDFNSQTYRASEIPSLNGYGTSRFLAKMYSDIAADNERLLSRKSVKEMLATSYEAEDKLLGWPLKMGLGVMLENPALQFLSDGSGFGHPGANGAIALGATKQRLGVSWCPSRSSRRVLEDPAVGRIMLAIKDCLG